MRKLEVYCGIADVSGLESFIPLDQCTDKALSYMHLRCTYFINNSALIYRAFLLPEDVTKIEEFLSTKKFKHALCYIKWNAVEIRIQNGKDQKKWDAIPKMTLSEIKEIESLRPRTPVEQTTNQLELL